MTTTVMAQQSGLHRTHSSGAVLPPTPSASLPVASSVSSATAGPQATNNSNGVTTDPNYATFFEEFWNSSWPLSQGFPSPSVTLLDYKDYYSPPHSPGTQQQQQQQQQVQGQSNALSIYNQVPSSPTSTALIVPQAQSASSSSTTSFAQQQNTVQFQLNLNFPNSHSLNSPTTIPPSLSSAFQNSSFAALPSSSSSSSSSSSTKDKKENGKGGKSRKKTSRACVYCQRSHSCCDVYRPCSKCVQRGIGHLCRDGEPKTTKRREYLYLLADNVEGSTTTTTPASQHKRQKITIEEHHSPPACSEACNSFSELSTISYQEVGSTNLNFAQIFGSRKRRPFPKDIRISFHRLAERCGHWTDNLISMWSKVEQFWCRRDSLETPQMRKENSTGFRRQVVSRANAIMQLLNDLSEPMLIWSEGLRIYAVNKAAQAFFGRTAEEMTNANLGYEDDEEDEEAEWHPEQDLETRDHAFRLFDLIHPDDAAAFGCSAAADAMSLFPLNDPSYNAAGEALERTRGFRMKVRANLTKQQANRANVVPTVIHGNSNATSALTYDSVTCVVTQSHFRDSKGRFMFASCTFVRIDDL